MRTVPRLGIILDSGGVLVRPRNGRWFPPPAFSDVLDEQGLTPDEAALGEALAAGERYLNEVHAIPLADEVAERPVWVRYYEIVLESAGVTPRRTGLAKVIAERQEHSLPLEPFPWTLPVLSELQRRKVGVVVLSDAWPSLRRHYRQLGLDRYVDAMVISAEEGLTKPDPKVFTKARGLLGEAQEIVFVDDWAGHVRAAIGLGMRGLRLLPAGEDPDPFLEEISDLRQLLEHL
jgi:putative hydrolase of the HAD superfamily